MGERYSNKRPVPKHAKKNNGGGIRIAALSFGSLPIVAFFESFPIFTCIEHLTACYVKTQPLIKFLFPTTTTLMVYFILEEVNILLFVISVTVIYSFNFMGYTLADAFSFFNIILLKHAVIVVTIIYAALFTT